MRIGIFGDGTLNPASDSRDGSKGDRRSLVSAFTSLGAEVTYLTLLRKAGGG
jgi:hypothetical protein